MDKDAVSSEGGSDADRDEKPAPRSAQSILASSASATVIAQEVKLRSRGELREGEWQARGTSESKDQFDDGVEKALEAVGMAAPDISQTEVEHSAIRAQCVPSRQQDCDSLEAMRAIEAGLAAWTV